MSLLMFGSTFPTHRLLVPQRVQHCLSLASSSQRTVKYCRGQFSVVAITSASASASASSASSILKPQKEVALESEVGVSYEALRDLLIAGEWEAADGETRRLLCVLAGEGAVKRKWVYFSEVQFIPTADLKTVDELWRVYSNNKFGYSVQRRVWKNVSESWTAFFAKVSWTKPIAESRNDAYKKFPVEFMWDVADPTPPGHLPLTNALRGTQLLEKLLSHPAFDFAEEEEKMLLPSTDNLTLSQKQQRAPQLQKGVFNTEDMTADYGF